MTRYELKCENCETVFMGYAEKLCIDCRYGLNKLIWEKEENE